MGVYFELFGVVQHSTSNEERCLKSQVWHWTNVNSSPSLDLPILCLGKECTRILQDRSEVAGLATLEGVIGRSNFRHVFPLSSVSQCIFLVVSMAKACSKVSPG